jgi:hypothetical protein
MTLKFNHLDTNHDHGYVDVMFADNSPKSDLRLWVVTYDCEAGKWYGMMRRSETVEDSFDEGVYLPAKMVAAIVTANPECTTT